MIPLKEVIRKMKEGFVSLEVRYVHPSLYLIAVDDCFKALDQSERISLFFSRANASEAECSPILTANNAILCLVTTEERKRDLDFIDESPSAHHWIEFLADTPTRPKEKRETHPRIIHFYGYKGGQGRSTVLTMLSKALAGDGYRVLAVDADIEAPSLQSQYGSRIDALGATLVGCVQYDLPASPQQVFVPRSTSGRVDLIACKPSGPAYDLELASLALSTALNPAILQEGFGKIVASSSVYDLILVDHRSGISSSVLPLITGFPGPTVICIRLDEQSDESDEYLKVLLSRNPDMPGLFISFSLDPEENTDKPREKSQARVEGLLDILGRCLDAGAEQADADNVMQTSPDALRPYWIPWFHDRSFLAKPTPDYHEILPANQESIQNMREILDCEMPVIPVAQTNHRSPSREVAPPRLTNSGNTDEGVLIQTDALRRLRASNSGYRYIFGRKGTGKTRLVRALVEESHGRTLLSAEDTSGTDSISSADPLFGDLSELLLGQQAAEKLWWIILDCGLNSASRPAPETLKKWFDVIKRQGSSAVETSAIAEQIYQLQGSHVFLVDGVETAFSSAQMPTFVQGLFRFLALMQSNAQIANHLTIRLFLRTDLAQFAAENFEQQTEGRKLTLSWDTQSILNFALSRIAALNWFRKTFVHTVNEIETRSEALAEGNLSVEDCNEILLKVFPHKVKRNNLLTLTFLKTYFSEGEGETASFYPRIYDAFLRAIDNPASIGGAAARLAHVEDDRVGQQLIVKAHDYASEQYLKQVAAELRNLVSLSDDAQLNASRVDALLPVFRGLPTPFDIDTCITAVHGKLNDEFPIDRERVKSALEQMKRVGIFEDRPGFGGQWRAGRLFKNALGMKYVR